MDALPVVLVHAADAGNNRKSPAPVPIAVSPGVVSYMLPFTSTMPLSWPLCVVCSTAGALLINAAPVNARLACPAKPLVWPVRSVRAKVNDVLFTSLPLLLLPFGAYGATSIHAALLVAPPIGLPEPSSNACAWANAKYAIWLRIQIGHGAKSAPRLFTKAHTPANVLAGVVAAAFNTVLLHKLNGL